MYCQVPFAIDNVGRMPSFCRSVFPLRKGFPGISPLLSSSSSPRLYKEELVWICLIIAWLQLLCTDVAISARLCIPCGLRMGRIQATCGSDLHFLSLSLSISLSLWLFTQVISWTTAISEIHVSVHWGKEASYNTLKLDLRVWVS